MAKGLRQQELNESFTEATKEVAVTPPALKSDDDETISKLILKQEKPKKAVPKEPEVYIFKLLTGANPPPKRMSVSNEMPIYHSDTESNRTIRLLRGVSSIFVDEQVGLTPQFVQRNKLEITFLDGILRVPRTNRTLLNFLLESDEFDRKQNRMRVKRPVFTLINTQEIEEAELAKEEFEFNAVKYAMTAKDEDMIPHAVYLGINMVNSFGEPKSPAKIRIDYAAQARRLPEKFMRTANSPIIKTYYLITKALEAGVIDTTKRSGYAVWAENMKPIVELKFGKPVVEQIAEYAMSESDEAKLFYKQLKSVLL